MEKVKRLHTEEKSGKLPNSLGPYILQLVVENAGAILLRLPELVRTSLRDPECKRIVAKALANIGPPALAFVPDLFSEDRGVEFPEAVAAIGVDDRATVLRLLSLAKSDDRSLAWAASNVLERIGPNAARLAPTAVDELLEVLRQSERLDLLGCIASMAPHRRDAFEAVIAAARPSPPQMRTEEGYTYDAVMFRRGVAVDALGHFAGFGEEAVPVLVEALDSFEEYDPDWGYENGNYGRIVSALSKLGPAAAAAVPALLAHLRDSEGDVEWPIVRLLGRLGPAARAALPVLEELQADEKSRSLLGEDDPPCETLQPVAWAIYQIAESGSR